MNPTDFICGLMRANSDALGFIPRPTLQQYFVPKYLYIIQQNRFHKPVGYILHGPVDSRGIMRIHQACIDIEKRNRGFGARAVQRLVKRAISLGAHTILLRCAEDLDAIAFWIFCGFYPTHFTPGGKRRNRTIVHLRMDL